MPGTQSNTSSQNQNNLWVLALGQETQPLSSQQQIFLVFAFLGHFHWQKTLGTTLGLGPYVCPVPAAPVPAH